MRRLTTTSYAILGLLAIRPRSAYDLVEQMRRSNIRLIWPRAESKLYEEPKNLVAHGLARVSSVGRGGETLGTGEGGGAGQAEPARPARRARPAPPGGRRPTVYQITPAGRRALRRWLDQPAAGALLEFEGMLKVVYGDFGSKAQLLTNIRRIHEDIVRDAGRGVALVRELADEGPRFPERAHVIAIVDRYLVELMETTLRWSQWAESVVARWPGTTLDAVMGAQARTVLRENAAAVEAVAAGAAPRAKRVDRGDRVDGRRAR